ncbi:unnamed protein product [Alopecurus aequalis]
MNLEHFKHIEEEPWADEYEHTRTEDEEEDMQSEEDAYENDAYPLLPASLCPPAHGHEDPWRGPVLLDLEAYFSSERRNATTASCEMRGGKGTIHVTFCIAAPPLVSYFCLHYTDGLKLSHFEEEPEIVASEGGLALLCVHLDPGDSDCSDDEITQYFIYRAGAIPSLTQLPDPRPHHLSKHDITILRHCPNRRRGRGHRAASDHHDCGHCKYTIASLRRTTHQTYKLTLLHSDTMKWSCEIILTDKDFHHSSTTNMITIGGKRGTVGWVDLWRGILFCDVLAAEGRRALRYVPLPPSLVENPRVRLSRVEKEHFRTGTPRVSRDIAVVNGFIRCVDLQGPRRAWVVHLRRRIHRRWMVDAGTAQPTLRTLHVGQPTLSLDDDGIVYFLAKIDHRDDDRNGWVLAVDTAKKTIHGVAEFGCERTLGLGLVYVTSRISEYFQATLGG